MSIQIWKQLHPPKSNMTPENRPMEKEIPIGNQLFLSLC